MTPKRHFLSQPTTDEVVQIDEQDINRTYIEQTWRRFVAPRFGMDGPDGL
jgi:hypothetical protein